MKRKQQKQEITVWDQADPLNTVLKVIACIILISIFGFVIWAFSIV